MGFKEGLGLVSVGVFSCLLSFSLLWVPLENSIGISDWRGEF
jgi:hypothetical protein